MIDERLLKTPAIQYSAQQALLSPQPQLKPCLKLEPRHLRSFELSIDILVGRVYIWLAVKWTTKLVEVDSE